MNAQRFFLATVATVALALAGCGGPGSTASPSGAPSSPTSAATTPAGGGTTVDVIVQEFSVLPEVATAPAGEVTFVVTNDGPDDLHEFVIIQTDLAPDALPTDANGMVDEAGGGMTVIDEIEDIEVGDTQEVTATLAAGNYALICNIYDADEDEAHYEMGMYTGFTVE
jgi:uncharacterized cupredoxin-like copper-binding protein